MSTRRLWTALLAGLALLSTQVSDCAHITELRVPEFVQHDTNSTALLDCDYDLTEKDISILLVKWYFQDESHQVYQWVKNRPPSDAGVLKGRVNLGHVASPDPFKKHRAVSITNPTVELTGVYICKVVTDKGHTMQQKKMIVYSPARTMNLTQEKPSPTSVNITCLVEGVFPQPKLEMFALQDGRDDSRRLLEEVLQETTETEEGFYDAEAHVTVEDSSLEGSTTFQCVLTIPETEYFLDRSLSYASGPALSASTSRATQRAVVATAALVPAFLLSLLAVVALR